MTLNWSTYYDENGNTAWRADGPYSDTIAEWRLEPELRDDSIMWLARHTEELGESFKGFFWPSLNEAKLEIEAAHERILTECEYEEDA